MKLNLPPKSPPANALEATPSLPMAAALKLAPVSLPKENFYRTAEEAIRRKQAILAQLEHKRMLAKAALHAGRVARQSSHL